MAKKKKKKYFLEGYGEIHSDDATIKQLEKTKTKKATVKFDAAKTKVRISILMEGDLLSNLKQEAKQLGIPYQTLMKELIRKQLHNGNEEKRAFGPEHSRFKYSYDKDRKLCLKKVS